jgi:putative hemolysin
MKTVVLDKEDVKRIAPFFATKVGEKLIDFSMSVMALDKVNALYGRCCSKRGAEFATALLEDLRVNVELTNPEMLAKLPEGAFVTVSNHPFGALDGISLISFFGTRRPDYKVMVNSLLTYIEAMSPNFIAVEPYTSKKGSATNLHGIKESMRHLREGHPLGFFPAGGVSELQGWGRIEDAPWADNIVRLISQLKKPVVPVYFHGRNSLFFYLLGVVSWKIRTIRLCPEVFRAQGSTIRITLGEPILPEKLAEFDSPHELGAYLREQTYAAGRKAR